MWCDYGIVVHNEPAQCRTIQSRTTPLCVICQKLSKHKRPWDQAHGQGQGQGQRKSLVTLNCAMALKLDYRGSDGERVKNRWGNSRDLYRVCTAAHVTAIAYSASISGPGEPCCDGQFVYSCSLKFVCLFVCLFVLLCSFIVLIGGL